jgi:predicted RNA-binding protein YlxR (DUF448 family)
MTVPISTATPMRTCIGCRQQEPQTKLIRVVLSDGKAMLDLTKTAPGRGAYLHQDSECINTAVTRKLLTRALKAQSNLDVTKVFELVSNK